MDKIDFIQQLFAVFPPEKNLDATMSFYSSALESDKKYNYDKLLKIVAKDYSYKTPPPTAWLLKKRAEECELRRAPKYSGREGEIIKHNVRGVEYEFVVVPNNWEKVKTMSQFDKEIEGWNNRHEYFEQQSVFENQEGF